METRIDQKRGCGWREPGGFYMVNMGRAQDCGKLPIPLEICPTCGGGIHFARSWTWVNGYELIKTRHCVAEPTQCVGCILSFSLQTTIGRLRSCGLLWVGEKFYKTPTEYMTESAQMGISRRINNVPTDFKVGQTIVLLAHIRAIKNYCNDCGGAGTLQIPKVLKLEEDEHLLPEEMRNVRCQGCDGTGTIFRRGIFSAFVPSAIEYVTKGDETADHLAALERRGITPVKVVRSTEIEAKADA